MKQVTSFLLALLLATGALAAPVLAVGEAYTFTLTVNGAAKTEVMVGDTVTVALRISSAQEIQLYGMQDYINFNSELLEYIPGTERFFELNGYAVLTGAVLSDGNQVFVNRAGLSPIAMKTGDLLMQFDLKARKAGEAAITSSDPEMLDFNVNSYPVTLVNASVTIRQPHVHTPVHVAEIPATEQNTGVKEHWRCSGCGKLFLDKDGKQEATETDLLIPVKQHVHVLVHNPAKPATETVLGLREHWQCSGCGKLFLDKDGKQETTRDGLILPKLPHVHKMEHFAEKPATEQQTGLREYWRCSGCGKLYLDKDGKTETSQEGLILPKLNHVHKLEHFAEKPATQQQTGLKEHWHCTGCGKLFLDAQGKQEVTQAQLVIAKLPVTPDPKPVPQPKPDPVTPVTPVKPVEPAKSVFTDVPAGSWFAEAVDWAVEHKITQGTSKTTFGPEEACTRAQAVTFLWRAAGCPAPKGSSCPFTDVPADAWFRDAVLWAMENKITQGVSTREFGPELTCTRSQIVTFLWRAKGNPAGESGLPFTDVPAKEWFAAPVQWAVDNGITQGTSKTTFSPLEGCTRSQIVTFLWRDR